jgi:hypothetical protein
VQDASPPGVIGRVAPGPCTKSKSDPTFYGFAQFAGSDLERFGFETTPNTAIDASAAIATPELSTWTMMILGFVGTVLVARRRRSFRFV